MNEDRQAESRFEAAEDFQTSLEELQDLIIPTEEQPKPESSQLEERPITLAELEDAIADIEQFFNKQPKSE